MRRQKRRFHASPNASLACGRHRRIRLIFAAFSAKNIINGLLRVPLCGKIRGFGAENRWIGFVSAGNQALARLR